MESSATSSGDTSPTVSVRRGPPGSHQSRLEAARARAKIWTETHSDPGPVERYASKHFIVRRVFLFQNVSVYSLIRTFYVLILKSLRQ
jgi:hypothetical protein